MENCIILFLYVKLSTTNNFEYTENSSNLMNFLGCIYIFYLFFKLFLWVKQIYSTQYIN